MNQQTKQEMTPEQEVAPEVGMIWGQTPAGVIGASGEIPWYVSEDFQHFKSLTLGCPVIMGRATWDSLPAKNRPLPGRKNIVVTRNRNWQDGGAEVAYSLAEAIDQAKEDAPSETVWIIGGQALFQEGSHLADRIERTIIDVDVDGDTFAPELSDHWRLTEPAPEREHDWLVSKKGIRYRFEQLRRTR